MWKGEGRGGKAIRHLVLTLSVSPFVREEGMIAFNLVGEHTHTKPK